MICKPFFLFYKNLIALKILVNDKISGLNVFGTNLEALWR